MRKLRESKDLKQEQIAAELSMSPGGYSKIERGKTNPSVARLKQIARVLEVDIMYFLEEAPGSMKVEDSPALYGFATKSDILEINNSIRQLKQEIDKLKQHIAITNARASRRKK